MCSKIARWNRLAVEWRKVANHLLGNVALASLSGVLHYTTVIFNVIRKRISPVPFHLIALGIKEHQAAVNSTVLNSGRRIFSSQSRVRRCCRFKEKKKNQKCLIDSRLPGIISSNLSQTSSSLLRCNCDWRIWIRPEKKKIKRFKEEA